jgi:hypothetical protein
MVVSRAGARWRPRAVDRFSNGMAPLVSVLLFQAKYYCNPEIHSHDLVLLASLAFHGHRIRLIHIHRLATARWMGEVAFQQTDPPSPQLLVQKGEVYPK